MEKYYSKEDLKMFKILKEEFGFEEESDNVYVLYEDEMKVEVAVFTKSRIAVRIEIAERFEHNYVEYTIVDSMREMIECVRDSVVGIDDDEE